MNGIDRQRWEAARERHNNRRMCFELLCQFFDRAIEDDNVETAKKAFDAIDRVYWMK